LDTHFYSKKFTLHASTPDRKKHSGTDREWGEGEQTENAIKIAQRNLKNHAKGQKTCENLSNHMIEK
jgi:hypothetical protein